MREVQRDEDLARDEAAVGVARDALDRGGEQDVARVAVGLAGWRDDLERFLFEKLMKVDGVDRIRTSIVLKELKTSTALPL